MNKLDMKIGYQIRNIREEYGYSREYLSSLTGISVRFLYDVENCQRDMAVSNLI